jgi:hypothetical protein
MTVKEYVPRRFSQGETDINVLFRQTRIQFPSLRISVNHIRRIRNDRRKASALRSRLCLIHQPEFATFSGVDHCAATSRIVSRSAALSGPSDSAIARTYFGSALRCEVFNGLPLSPCGSAMEVRFAPDSPLSKADSNHQFHSWYFLRELPERPGGSRVRLRSCRQRAIAAGAVPAAVPFTAGPMV